MRTHKHMVPLAALTAAALTLSLALTGCSGKEEPASEPVQEEAAQEEQAAEPEVEAEAEAVEEEPQAEPVWVVSKTSTHMEWYGENENISDYVRINELDEHGNVVRITDEEGTAIVEYAHDENGNITSMTYPNLDGAEDEESEYTYTYENDEEGRATHSEGSDGSTVDYTYDAEGHIVKEESYLPAYTVDENGGKIEGTDFTMHMVYEYDENGFMTTRTENYSESDSSITTYAYELGDNGLPVTGTATSVNGDYTSEESLAYEYDENGNITHFERVSDLRKFVMDYEYVEVADPSAHVRTWSALRSSN